MIVLDTNILLYAVGRAHPLREPCRRFVDAAGEGTVQATTSIGVIAEFLYARGHTGRADAADLAREFAGLFAPLLVVDADDLLAGVRLFERAPGLDAFDAILAAASLKREAQALVSADRAFASVPKLNHVIPGTEAFEALLGG